MERDVLFIVVARQDVDSGDVGPTLVALNELIKSPQSARRWRERVDLMFEGYNQSREELFEMPVVRSFVQRLDEHFPYWLFFLSKAHFGLQCVLLCFLPPFLTAEAKARIFPEALGKLLGDRWFPAMNYVCSFVGMTEMEIERMTERVIEYVRAG